MIKFAEGNIFESPAQTLVNTVNTVGAMGKGIAKDFKRLFPEMFIEYQELCESGKIDIGTLWIYRTSHKSVLNFPTKKHWRQASQLEYIEKGLDEFIKIYEKMRISSIAFPRLGCGNGELDWAIVRPLMISKLGKLPIDIYIYEKFAPLSPEHKNIKMMKEWLKSEPASYPFSEFKDDLRKIIKDDDKFIEDYNTFNVIEKKDGTEFLIGDKILFVPWEGNEFGSGWREIWKYLRTNGICTSQEITNMGFEFSDFILRLLLSLSYLQQIVFIDNKVSLAVQLKPIKPMIKDLDLFSPTNKRSEIIRIE